MRIVIDLQSAQTGSRVRGIGRYSVALVKAMSKQAGNHEIWVTLNTAFPAALEKVRETLRGVLPPERIRVFDVPLTLSSGRWERAASNLIREAFLDSLKPDIVLISSLFEGYGDVAVTSIGAIETGHPTAVIVYDLIPLIFAETYLAEKDQAEYYREKLHWLENADLLLSISESSKRECIDLLGFADNRVTNISAAIESDFGRSALDSEAEQALFGELGIERKIVLYVPGGFDERKNFERLIKAYALLGTELREQHQLVITSSIHEPARLRLRRAQSEYGLSADEMVLTDYLSDAALVSLYRNAELFVFPSLHEGFGLPLLEAMACGTPVIGSNNSSIPEVIGDRNALFDPTSVGSIHDKLRQALDDESFRDLLKQNASTQLERFSWKRCAEKAIEAIERLVERSQPRETNTVSQEALLRALVKMTGGPPSEKEALRAARSIAFNSGPPNRRQLLLDISSIVSSDGKTGIQRVVRSLLNELLKNHHDEFSIKPIYFGRDRYYYANRFARQHIAGWSDAADDPIDLFQDDIYLSLDLNLHLPEMFPLHQQMRLLGIRVCFIVYDLLLTKRPDWWPDGMAAMFERWLKHVTGTADRLLCISNAVADDVRVWIQQNAPRRPGDLPEITSFKLGADIDSSLPSTGMPDDAEKVLRQLSASPSFLMVGTIEPRKGHAQVLAAFETLWSRGLNVNLVIVGKAGWLVDDLVTTLEHHPERRRRLFWLNGISDQYLKAVYSSASCLLTASEGEGFGLPLIEAAQHGLPIIARDLPVFREVANESAYFFSSEQSDDLAADLIRWLDLFEKGDHPRSTDMRWNTWAESAKSLVLTTCH